MDLKGKGRKMKYTRLGNSGLEVSQICLGCMSFGTSGKLFDWCVDEQKAEEILKTAIDLGINFFDTANVYTDGEAEEFMGRILKRIASRDEIVIATKCGLNMDKNHGPNRAGCSRKHIFDEVEKSLKRLDTDYIDLYYVHRYDPHTPLEETMKALNDLVGNGKVRYIGASNFPAWAFCKAQAIAEKHGWAKFICLENKHNLLNRQDEKEVFPMLEDEGASYIPYQVLAGGRLSRKEGEITSRSQTQADQKVSYHSQNDALISQRVEELAEKYGCSKANVIVAYELSKPATSSIIIGTTNPDRLRDTVKGIDIHLTPEDIAYLEELYLPR